MPSIKQAINAAIKQEEYSYKLYMSMQKQVVFASAKQLLRRLAKEELLHKKALKTLDPKKLELKPKKRLYVAKSIAWAPITELGGIRSILRFAIHKEEQAYQRYRKFAQTFSSKKINILFTKLAEQEKNHKRLLTAEYKKAF